MKLEKETKLAWVALWANGIHSHLMGTGPGVNTTAEQLAALSQASIEAYIEGATEQEIDETITRAFYEGITPEEDALTKPTA